MEVSVVDIDLADFAVWLVSKGYSVTPNLDPHELIRFRKKRVCILYKSGKSNNREARDVLLAYATGNDLEMPSPPTRRLSGGYKGYHDAIILRDGRDCFLCKKQLGRDKSVEHLIPLDHGGLNEISNMVLMHEDCNRLLGNLPLAKKIDIIVGIRMLKFQKATANRIQKQLQDKGINF